MDSLAIPLIELLNILYYITDWDQQTKDIFKDGIWRSFSIETGPVGLHTHPLKDADPEAAWSPPPWVAATYLQDEDEVVHGFALLVDVVVGRPLVTVVELDLLDHVGVAQDSQQHLVWDLRRAEEAHLWRERWRKRLSYWGFFDYHLIMNVPVL